MHPTVAKLRKVKKISLNKWAKAHGFSEQYCSAVIRGTRGSFDFGKALEIKEALKVIGVWVETGDEGMEDTK